MALTYSLTRTRSLLQGWTAGLAAFLILIALHFSGALPRLEHAAQDQLRVRLAKDYVSPIEIVVLDDVSLRDAEAQFGVKYPWPREVYGQAVAFLKRAGAKAVVFDFLFTSGAKEGGDDDLSFASAMLAQGSVVLGMQFTDEDQPAGRAAFLSQGPLYQVALPGLDLPQAKGVDAPKGPLWGAAAGVGDVSFLADMDGMARQARLALSLGERTYPSLALSGATLALRSAPKIISGPRLQLGELSVPIDSQGRLTILMRKPKGPKASTRLLDLAISELKLREGQLPLIQPEHFKDKVVVIGSTAPGLMDLRPTPLDPRLPGVELQAMVVDNLLSGQALRVWGLRPGMWLLLLALCLLIARTSFSFRGVGILVPAGLASLGALTLAVWAYGHLVLLPLAAPILAALLALSHSAVEHFVSERAQRRKVQDVFGKFLSPTVLSSLRSSGGKMEMGGETRELTVFFSDLAGFTSFSEKLSPHALVEILNEYLEEMAEVVVGRFDGYVDKYIGDAIMAFWNAPTAQKDHALRACQAAWHCQRRLGEIQGRLAELGLDAGDEGLVMRVGINTGPAVVGLMGSQRKLNYTVMGDTVNTASRLEGANKPYGSRVMLSDSTRAAAGEGVLVRTLDLLRVKGKAEPTPVFELIGLGPDTSGQAYGARLYDGVYVKDWESAMKLYSQGEFPGAKAAFLGLAGREPKDSVARLYVERCEHFIQEPPEHWDGVYVMKTK